MFHLKLFALWKTQKMQLKWKKLIFRLFLVDILNGKKQLLLPKALFVQWVIQSDVVVAQTDTNLAIWYNIDMPEHITLMPVRGEVTEIIRENVSSTSCNKKLLFCFFQSYKNFFFSG